MKEKRWRIAWDRLKKDIEYYTGNVKWEKVPPTRREIQIFRRRAFLIIVGVAIMGLAVWGIISFYNGMVGINSDDFSDSDKYMATISLFSTIIGAIVTITVTYFIVHNSKKVDYHQERLSHMPIIGIQLQCNKEGQPSTMEKNENGVCKIPLEMKNIGNGIALEIEEEDNDSDPFEVQNLPVNSTVEYIHYYSDSSSDGKFKFRFQDIFENKYSQEFSVKIYSDITRITCKPPELVRKTRRVRYCQ